MITAEAILYLTSIIFGLVEFMIGLRILLKLMGASTVAPFVRWVYDTSQPLLTPFEGMFPTTNLAPNRYPSGRFTLEFSALFALIVYAFIGYLITEALRYFIRRRIVYSDEEKGLPRRKRRVIEEEE